MTALQSIPADRGTMPTYSTASDADVLRNYEAACATEVAYHERGEEPPAIVRSACDAWMHEGMRRGIL